MFIVAPHCQIMAQLGLKDSSRNLKKPCNCFFPHLILHTYIQTFDVMGEKFLFLGTKQPLYSFDVISHFFKSNLTFDQIYKKDIVLI